MTDLQWSTNLRDSEYDYLIEDDAAHEPITSTYARDEVAEIRSLDSSFIEEDDVHFVETPLSDLSTIAQRLAASRQRQKRKHDVVPSNCRGDVASKKQHICGSQPTSVTTEPTSPSSSTTFPAASSSGSTLRTSPPQSDSLRDLQPSTSTAYDQVAHAAASLTQAPAPTRSFPPLRPARVGLSKPATTSRKTGQQQLCFSQIQGSQQVQSHAKSVQTESNSIDSYYDGFFCWGDELEIFRDAVTPEDSTRAHLPAESSSLEGKRQRSRHFGGLEQYTDASYLAEARPAMSKPSTPIVIPSSDSEDDDSDIFAFDPRRESLSTAASSIAPGDVIGRSLLRDTSAAVTCLPESIIQYQQAAPQTSPIKSRLVQRDHDPDAQTRSSSQVIRSLRAHQDQSRWSPPMPATTDCNARYNATISYGSSESSPASLRSRLSAAGRSSLSTYSFDTRSQETRQADRAHRRRLAPPLTPAAHIRSATPRPSHNSAVSRFAPPTQQTSFSYPKAALSDVTSTPFRRWHANDSPLWHRGLSPISGGGGSLVPRRNGVSRAAREAVVRRFNIAALSPGAPTIPLSRAGECSFGQAQGSRSSENGYAIRKLPPDVDVTVQHVGGSDGVKRRLTLFKPSGRTQW
ncbi:hypothetical protein BCV69DRAFT_312884 [Microstroma glucosiphilum]|uniref:Uncharacterized protein n=1 Tax=Pseudomicrostroma glucosiphilum TaxID=1684307 RepID=A0A316U4V7_9BASI|nr:hypothetical protein BCV69DRAFT_312884 [Pseudomicrostroma glucosiphilum]PWN20287.1 hypothetical protein BCV69DRAFT_312884 [Pseudomicrostroma glucosiphilum]